MFRALVAISLTSSVVFAYAMWTTFRLQPWVRMMGEPEYDPAFPRPLPWPDGMVLASEEFFRSYSFVTPVEPLLEAVGVVLVASLVSATASAIAAYFVGRAPNHRLQLTGDARE